jgi:L-threonylcarbamoyladenylate synthase
MAVHTHTNSEGRGSLDTAVQAVLQGQVLIYPTETLYALGANAMDHRAVERVVGIKGRAENKPLPVIIGSLHQFPLVISNVAQEVMNLVRIFWPGSLSIVVPARKNLSPLTRDDAGCTSVRWSPHPIAQALCVQSGVPLVGTSANLAGHPPSSRPKDLDPILIQSVDCFVAGPPYPKGGLPSTVVQVVGSKQLYLLRSGAVPERALQNAGWVIR